MKKPGKRIAPKVFYTLNNILKEITHNNIITARPFFNASLVGTVMKGLELELNEELPNVPIYFENTVTYDGDSSTKTIGPYYLKEKPEYNADSKTYLHTLYDNFLLGMIEYKPISISYPTTVNNFFKRLCEENGLTTDITSLPNGNRIIAYDIYKGIGFTMRDVYTDIGQATATLFEIDGKNVKKCSLGNTFTVIDDDILKNKNISLGEHFGPINSIILSRSADSDYIYKRDETLTKWNEFKISDNILMNDNNRSDYLSELYLALYGIEYDIFDLELVGYGGFEPLQEIRIETNGQVYESYVFNNEEIFTQGYEENIHTDMPGETTTDYTISDRTDRRIKETYLIVNKQNQKIEAAVTNSEKALSQTTNLTIELGKIQGLISESVDTTKSAEGTGTITLENINQSEPVMLQIHPTTEDISYLYPRDDLYPSDNLFLKGRTVIFENTTTKKKVEYELPSDLLKVGSVYDEFTLDLKNRICSVTKRIGVNSSGEHYILAQDQTLNFTYPTIALEDGNYKIYMQSFSTAHIFCRLMTKNIYTEQFATNIQLESAITQLRDSITLSVKQTLTNYSTTTEMNSAIVLKANEITNSVSKTLKDYATTSQVNSAISQKANEITSTVSETYATKNQLKNYSTTSQMNSAITQKANSITSSVNGQFTTVNGDIKKLSASLELKLNEKDFYTELNGKADKIHFKGDRFSWQSTNSSLTENGALTVKSGDIAGFVLNKTSFTKNLSGIYNYTEFDLQFLRFTLLNYMNLSKNSSTTKILDVYEDNELDITDLARMRQILLGQVTNSRNVTGKIAINSNNPKNCLIIQDSSNKTVVSLGLGGVNANQVISQNILCADTTSNSTNLNTYVAINGINGNISVSGTIKCATLTQTSVVEKKKNFELYNNALKEIQKIDIYKYNLKQESNNTKKHLGFVIGKNYKYSKLITSHDNKEVDLYSMSSLCIQALKELLQRIEKLESRLNYE